MNKGNIIITGVSSGIGHAIASAALSEGYHVQGIGRTAPSDLENVSNWRFTACDLTNLKSIDNLTLYLGENNILINNAGTLGPVMFGEKTDTMFIDYCFRLNVSAPIRLTARFLSESTGKQQVYFTGSGAAEYPISGWSVYCASKASIHMYAKVLSTEYPNIPIHVFKPGKVDTPMQEIIRKANKEDFPAVSSFISEYESGKLIKPQNVAKHLLSVIQSIEKPDVVFSISPL
ncbi:MAG: SDR family NAD(P)-dependent oxidoreductase [Bacteroidota bacterium]|nr:SDR family NAD(P)-dependent oxidoreductase [Bacteroidota bacterium]